MFKNKCIECKGDIKRGIKFCSSSCAAKYNNRVYPKRTKGRVKPNCLSCNKQLDSYVKKYCDNVCQKDRQYKAETKPRFEKGLIKDRNTLRRLLNIERGTVCSVCNIVEWNGKKIVLEVDHVDGNADNNMPDNLRLICPNCHSQTETYKGANKGNGRKLGKLK